MIVSGVTLKNVTVSDKPPYVVPTAVTSGLMLYWDPGVGDLTDQSGNGRNATLFNSPVITAGLANGIWTMGITWGVWTSPAAQKRADLACILFGVLLAAVGLGALGGAASVDIEAAKEVEDRIYQAKLAAGEISPNPHKRGEHHAHEDAEKPAETAAPATETTTSLTVPATAGDDAPAVNAGGDDPTDVQAAGASPSQP